MVVMLISFLLPQAISNAAKPAPARPAAKKRGISIPVPGGGRWILFRPGVSHLIGSKPIAIEGDCRTVAVLEIYHQPRLIAGQRIGARKFEIKVCCRAKTIQVLQSTHLDLKGEPALKSLKAGPKVKVGNRPIILKMHNVACRLRVK